jgi:LmbE family N-acetylglucosaminyl deacetylase
VAASGEGRLALVWAPAVERGFAPALLPEPPIVFGVHDRLLVLAPHPDDEIVSNAGLIQAAHAAGAAVRIVWATDGENNPWAQLVSERRWPVSANDHARWGALRRGESRRALQVLGVPDAGQRWLGLPDGGLTRLWMSGDRRLADSLASAMQTFHPTIVSAPSIFDGHPDHSSMGLAANVALARIPDATRPRLLTYIAHHGDLAPDPTLRVSLTAAERQHKLSAIECLSSQLHWRRGELTAFADTAEWFGPADSVVAGCQVHRVRGAWIDGDRLVVDFTAGLWLGLPPEVLRISCDGRSGYARFTVPLIERTGNVLMRDGSGLVTADRARFSRVQDHWRVAMPLGFSELPRSAFVKVERPTDVGLGFFDESGWWPVATGTPRR